MLRQSALPGNDFSRRASRTPSPGQQPAGAAISPTYSIDEVQVEAGLLPALVFSLDDDIKQPAAATPDSGFIDQKLRGFTRKLPLSVMAYDTDVGVVLGHGGDGAYTAGLGWAPLRAGPRRVKFSLMRQKVVGEGSSGHWLAGVQSEAKSVPLLGGVNLQGELAVAREDGSVTGLSDSLGARIRMEKPAAEGFAYGVMLSQFGESFRATGSRVNAGRRRAAADMQYTVMTDIQLTANTSYTEHGTVGTPYRCDHYTEVTLAGPLLEDWAPSLKARLKTSTLRSLDCSGNANRSVDSWQLSFIEDDWTGWNLQLSLAETDISLPQTGNTLVNRSYHLKSRYDLRLGRHFATIGPALSLHTHSAGDVKRRLKAGFFMNFDSRLHSMNLRMGYESLNSLEALPFRDTVKIDLSYKLNFDV